MAESRKLPIPLKDPMVKKTDEPSLISLGHDPFQNCLTYLDTKDLIAVSGVCAAFYHYSKTPLNAQIAIVVKQLIKLVMDGAPLEEVKALLNQKKFPSSVCLVTCKNTGKEECGREWKNVSALEFAAWAGDYIKLIELLKHVPNNCKSEALAQLQDVKLKGLEHGKIRAPANAFIEDFTNIEPYTGRDHLETLKYLHSLDKKVNTAKYKLPNSDFENGQLGKRHAPDAKHVGFTPRYSIEYTKEMYLESISKNVKNLKASGEWALKLMEEQMDALRKDIETNNKTLSLK